MKEIEKIEIFKNDTEIFLTELDGLLLDNIVIFLHNKINFEIVYNNDIKFDILESVYYNIQTNHKKLTPETLHTIRKYLDTIYYKIAKKGVEIAKKQFEAETNAYYENLAREEIKAKKYSQELENYRKQHKKSWIQKLIDFI